MMVLNGAQKRPPQICANMESLLAPPSGFFDDAFAVHRPDTDGGYGEQRIIVTGMVNGVY